jgi:hypothetical protein
MRALRAKPAARSRRGYKVGQPPAASGGERGVDGEQESPATAVMPV